MNEPKTMHNGILVFRRSSLSWVLWYFLPSSSQTEIKQNIYERHILIMCILLLIWDCHFKFYFLLFLQKYLLSPCVRYSFWCGDNSNKQHRTVWPCGTYSLVEINTQNKLVKHVTVWVFHIVEHTHKAFSESWLFSVIADPVRKSGGLAARRGPHTSALQCPSPLTLYRSPNYPDPHPLQLQ